jgi:hypothetical protein
MGFISAISTTAFTEKHQREFWDTMGPSKPDILLQDYGARLVWVDTNGAEPGGDKPGIAVTKEYCEFIFVWDPTASNNEISLKQVEIDPSEAVASGKITSFSMRLFAGKVDLREDVTPLFKGAYPNLFYKMREGFPKASNTSLTQQDLATLFKSVLDSLNSPVSDQRNVQFDEEFKRGVEESLKYYESVQTFERILINQFAESMEQLQEAFEQN